MHPSSQHIDSLYTVECECRSRTSISWAGGGILFCVNTPDILDYYTVPHCIQQVSGLEIPMSREDKLDNQVG